MLVGTKTDLQGERMVATEEGEALAEREGLLFAETNIKQFPSRLFRAIGERIYERRELILDGVREHVVRPPSGSPPLASEDCCPFFY